MIFLTIILITVMPKHLMTVIINTSWILNKLGNNIIGKKLLQSYQRGYRTQSSVIFNHISCSCTHFVFYIIYFQYQKTLFSFLFCKKKNSNTNIDVQNEDNGIIGTDPLSSNQDILTLIHSWSHTIIGFVRPTYHNLALVIRNHVLIGKLAKYSINESMNIDENSLFSYTLMENSNVSLFCELLSTILQQPEKITISSI